MDLLLKLVRELPLADIYQMDAQTAHQAPSSSASRPKQSALEVSLPCFSRLHTTICAGGQLVMHQLLVYLIRLTSHANVLPRLFQSVYPSQPLFVQAGLLSQ